MEFIESVKVYFSEFTFSSAIMAIMMVFMFIGAFDRIRGNKWGYGKQFEEGFNAMGPLALVMVGMLAMAPVLKLVIEPVIGPVYGLIGASPSSFPATLLSSDMGGYSLALETCGGDIPVGLFSGLIIGSIMGPTITFTIPVALSFAGVNDRSYISMGVLLGLCAVPVGCLLGGLCMFFTPYKLAIGKILINMLPLLIIIVIVILCLWRFPKGTLKAFSKFGDFVIAIITIALVFAVFQHFTGIRIPVLDLMVKANPDTGISPLMDSFLIVGSIGMILLGAYPMVFFITSKLRKPLIKIGKKLSLNETDCGGLIASLANSIPMFSSISSMSGRGKLLNMAFAVSGAFVLGDHLGFTAGVNEDMILPVIVGKFTAGICAVILAGVLYNKLSAQLKS